MPLPKLLSLPMLHSRMQFDKNGQCSSLRANKSLHMCTSKKRTMPTFIKVALLVRFSGYKNSPFQSSGKRLFLFCVLLVNT